MKHKEFAVYYKKERESNHIIKCFEKKKLFILLRVQLFQITVSVPARIASLIFPRISSSVIGLNNSSSRTFLGLLISRVVFAVIKEVNISCLRGSSNGVSSISFLLVLMI